MSELNNTLSEAKIIKVEIVVSGLDVLPGRLETPLSGERRADQPGLTQSHQTGEARQGGALAAGLQARHQFGHRSANLPGAQLTLLLGYIVQHVCCLLLTLLTPPCCQYNLSLQSIFYRSRVGDNPISLNRCFHILENSPGPG